MMGFKSRLFVSKPETRQASDDPSETGRESADWASFEQQGGSTGDKGEKENERVREKETHQLETQSMEHAAAVAAVPVCNAQGPLIRSRLYLCTRSFPVPMCLAI
jgi:hypothetical protein